MTSISSSYKPLKTRIFLFVFLFLSNFGLFSQNSPYIITDQFGYRPLSHKIAVIRDPQIGYDASEGYNPGSNFSVIKFSDGSEVYSSSIKAWNNGNTDPISGDKVWHFDFSSVTEPGEYYILDKTTQQKSFNFRIHENVYQEVLKAAVKSFYYQRSGFEKKAIFAGSNWADGASHIGNLQDQNCRPYNAKTDASKSKDLSGGWYDAGDYNKYTSWTASYVVSLLQSFEENPDVWTDDYQIPESGNGIPDLLDEVLFGLEWLKKMQQSDGGCLSIVGCAHGTPPSASVGQSVYGPASTFATLKCAGAFAYASLVLRKYPQFQAMANDYSSRSESAWKWAGDHPNVLFPNNSSSNGSQGVGAGNQETDDLGRITAKLGAALYLYRATSKSTYKTYFENNYMEMPLFKWSTYISQYFFESQDILFQYTLLPDHTPSISNSIKSATLAAAKKSGDFADAILNDKDPYFSFIKDYNWGSNQYKSIYGNVFYSLSKLNIDPGNNTKYLNAAESYIHYIHGVNPFGMVYLSNMKSIGADKGITQFYHSWFADGSKWDQEGVSLYGPAPGFLAGGPNTSYSVDGCCPNNCGSAQNNAICTSQVLSPPLNQPAMKAYKDFNNSWPLNSWAISENSNGYQVAYIRLLSKFVSSGSSVNSTEYTTIQQKFTVYPNPTNGVLTIKVNDQITYDMCILDLSGTVIHKGKIASTATIDLENYPSGIYIISLSDGRNEWREKVVR
jgi:endoglucanase